MFYGMQVTCVIENPQRQSKEENEENRYEIMKKNIEKKKLMQKTQ